MKRWIALFLVLALVCAGLCGCQAKSKDVELTVFAAASLTETLTELG